MNDFFQNLAIYTAIITVAVFIGGVVPILKDWNHKRLPTLLSFAAGLMLGSVFFHLIPESYEILGKSVGLYLLLGFLVLFFIEKFITVHVCEIFDCEVHKLGVSALIGIGLHSLTDGIALGSSLIVPQLGFVVFLAVTAHKAPEVFSLTTALMHSHVKRSSILLANLLVLLMVPLGAILTYWLLQPFQHYWMGAAVAFSAGTFLHISLSDLLPEAHHHSDSKVKTTLAFLTGLVVMKILVHHFHLHG